MNSLISSKNSKQIYDYLFNNAEFINNEKNYYFWIIDIKEEKDIIKVLSFFEEMFCNVFFLELNNKYMMFYFKEIEEQIESIVASMIDDFSVMFKIYRSPQININNRDYFLTLNNLYDKYLSCKSNFYMTNIDLANEIIRNNIEDLKLLRPIIFNNILDDSQIETLIKAMFRCDLNVTKTASAIYMHRNTVINKLDYIKKETGLNIQKFSDANILYWLLKIK